MTGGSIMQQYLFKLQLYLEYFHSFTLLWNGAFREETEAVNPSMLPSKPDSNFTLQNTRFAGLLLVFVFCVCVIVWLL